MKLKPIVYENLTPGERIVASVEALARGDMDERQRLISSCPKKTVTQTDPAYSDVMERLIYMALAVQCDLRTEAICFQFALKAEEPFDMFLRRMASIQAAWHQTLEEYGIDPTSMNKATRPPHPIVDLLMDLVNAVEPAADDTKERKDFLMDYLGGMLK